MKDYLRPDWWQRAEQPLLCVSKGARLAWHDLLVEQHWQCIPACRGILCHGGVGGSL